AGRSLSTWCPYLRPLNNPGLQSFPTRRSSDRQRLMEVLAFGVVSAAVGALLRLPWLDIATAGMTGLLIGTLVQLARPRPRLRERSEEHTSELQSREKLVCRLLLEKKQQQQSEA